MVYNSYVIVEGGPLADAIGGSRRVKLLDTNAGFGGGYGAYAGASSVSPSFFNFSAVVNNFDFAKFKELADKTKKAHTKGEFFGIEIANAIAVGQIDDANNTVVAAQGIASASTEEKKRLHGSVTVGTDGDTVSVQVYGAPTGTQTGTAVGNTDGTTTVYVNGTPLADDAAQAKFSGLVTLVNNANKVQE